MKYFITLITFLCLASNLHANDTIVAVLEEPQCKELIDLHVRVLFAKKDNKFIALNNTKNAKMFDTNQIKWTIAFDGKNLGSITSYEHEQAFDDESTFCRDKLHVLNSPQNAPKIKNKSSSFSGWCNTPSCRPIILVSKPNYKDPETWKPFRPDRKILDILLPEIKERISNVVIIDPKTYKETPFNYQKKDLTIFKSYKSCKGSKLIQIGFDLKNIDCGGIVDPVCTPRWFYVNNTDNIKYVGKDLQVVDAGDYDNDGRSEVIFWYSGYNSDGYLMFYDNFTQNVEYLWSYH